MIDKILQKYGLTYDDLTTAEKATLDTWVKALQQKQITVSVVKKHIHEMKESVERELTQIGHESKQDIFLKARLRNYMLLEAFLATPEKAREALDRALAGIVRVDKK